MNDLASSTRMGERLYSLGQEHTLMVVHDTDAHTGLRIPIHGLRTGRTVSLYPPFDLFVSKRSATARTVTTHCRSRSFPL